MPRWILSLTMLQSLSEFWQQAMAIPAARWVLIVAGFTILMLISFYVIKLLRDMALGGGSAGLEQQSEFLTEFQKLRREGKLNEDEYSRLKDTIATVDSDGNGKTPEQDG